MNISFVDQPRTPLALVFTDSHGRVISIHGLLLDMMHYDNPGAIVGEPLHTVLGVGLDASKHLVENVARNGNVLDWALEIRPQAADPFPVLCTSVATFNDRGDFIGADITLHEYDQPAAEEASPASHEDTLITHIQQAEAGVEWDEDNALLQLYVAVQFSALQVLLARMAGLRVSKTLEATINKMADKRAWPLAVRGDRLLVEKDNLQPDIYRALLDETVRFAANVIGRRTVIAEMRAVDDGMDSSVVDLARQAGLRHLFSETGTLRSEQ